MLVGMLCWMVWTGFIGDGVWCVVGLCGLWVAGLIHSDGVMCCVCVGFGGVGHGWWVFLFPWDACVCACVCVC